MTVSIPQAGGVPGISGPPDWLSLPADGGSYFLDDVRWRGATRRSFGSGASPGGDFRALQATVGIQKFIYLSLRAAFVQQLSDNNDMVYLGLQKHGTTSAMVIRIQVHLGFTAAGKPSVNPPANVQSVQISTLSGGVWSVQAMSPTWIAANARHWLQNAGDVPADPNNRWAVQVRIPANTVGGITDNSGPNLATDFDMWYLIQGSSLGSPVILADYRTSGNTSVPSLGSGNYPLPAVWDEFQLTSGPASFGGVTIEGNGSNDVVVQNGLGTGTGTTIENGALNTFIARPRNYRPVLALPATNDIPAGAINATFRIANWGSQAGDPNNVDFTTGVWDYVPGNDAVTPVISGPIIPTLTALNNPPNTSPIALGAMMNLAAGKSKHQCILVTLSGTNLNFLNDSVFVNMNYNTASLLEREAEISIVGLAPFSATPRDVYLAIEKVNMARNTPGANEGQFLSGTMTRLLRQDGPIGAKLKIARSILSDVGHNMSSTHAEGAAQRLDTLINVLSNAGLTESEFDQLFPTFRVHVYHDTGEKVTGDDGQERPVLRAQSSFGHYVYHEGGLEGWQTSIEGAQRIADNLYLLPVPNNGSAKITTRIQAVENESERLPEDPITPPKVSDKDGCLGQLLKLLGKK